MNVQSLQPGSGRAYSGPKILPVIMSGGAGSRLWPLSRQSMAKQFLPLAGPRTMIQDTVARFSTPEYLSPVIVCNAAHVDMIRSQVDALSAIIVEPEGRNTGACAMIAALYAHNHLDSDTLILLAASDHVIERPDAFREAVRRAAPIAASGYHVTFGMTPDHAATGFGYIQQGEAIEGDIYRIESFREKPDAATARDYLASGDYHWNSGIFLLKPSLVIHEMLGLAADCANPARKAYAKARIDGDMILLDPAAFARCKPEPIDIALMERTRHGAVLPCALGWQDIGSFRAYRDLLATGNAPVVQGDGYTYGSSGSLIDTDGPLVAVVGLDDVAVIVRDGRVLVVALDASQDVKAIVDRLKADGRDDRL